MTERSVGIKTTGATDYVAAFTASEQADSHNRVVQIIAMTAGKIDTGLSRLGVAANDSMDITSVSGSLVVGDNSRFACYIEHSQSNGTCLVTPLLCDNDGVALGYLPAKSSSADMSIVKSGKYLSPCLSWEILNTGAWKIHPLIFGLSDGNNIDVYSYTF
jgi:hypothetical protein